MKRATSQIRSVTAAIALAVALASCSSNAKPAAAPAPTPVPTNTSGSAAAPATPAASGASVLAAKTSLGTILTDAKGMTLYMFTPDEAGTPTCAGGCAGAWPPSIVTGTPTAGDGIAASLVATVAHPDGGTQLKVGKWPLYTFGGDKAAGDTNGQGSGGSWYVVGVDGNPIK